MAQGWWSRNAANCLVGLAAAAVVAVVAWLFWPHQKGPAAPGPGPAGSPGWEVRYNATLALARRRSERARLDVLEEMLDEDLQLRNFTRTGADGRPVADEQAARSLVLKALDAVLWLHERPTDLSALDGALRKLAESPNLTVRDKARATLEQLGKG